MVRFFDSQSLFGYFLGSKSDKIQAKELILSLKASLPAETLA
jgi:hypothetical protein